MCLFDFQSLDYGEGASEQPVKCSSQECRTWGKAELARGAGENSIAVRPGKGPCEDENFRTRHTPRLAALLRRSRRRDSCESESLTLSARLNFYTCLFWPIMISTASVRTSDVFVQEDNEGAYVLFMYKQHPHVLRSNIFRQVV
jgi:hypothetical protein